MSDGGIRFAEKILTLLNEGQFASTYKYAVLLALLGLSLENVGRTGEPPEMFTTRQLTDKVIELYWPHSVPFQSGGSADVLWQNGGKRQAGIVRAMRGRGLWSAAALAAAFTFRGATKIARVLAGSAARDCDAARRHRARGRFTRLHRE